MVEPLESYDVATVLLWGADCVEHLAHRVSGVDGNVVETGGELGDGRQLKLCWRRRHQVRYASLLCRTVVTLTILAVSSMR